MRFIFLGPPGAGKGTCARKVAETLEIGHLSTGDYFRGLVAQEDPVGIAWKRNYWERGMLVPDKETIGVLFKKLKEPQFQKGYILDGFPRTIPQAEALYDAGVNLNKVLNFKISNEALIERVSSRMTCRGCNASYNPLSAKPAKEGICDRCSGELYQRDDEKPEIFKTRLEVYEKQTAPLIEYYLGKGLLANIDGSRSIEKVLEDALAILK